MDKREQDALIAWMEAITELVLHDMRGWEAYDARMRLRDARYDYMAIIQDE